MMTHTTSTKPIISIGKYALIYRTQQGFVRCEQQEQDTPFGFWLLSSLAQLGIITSLFGLVTYTLAKANLPFLLTMAIALALVIVVIFASRAFFASFRLIDTTKPTLPSTNLSRISPMQWGYVGALAVLGVLQLGCRHLADLSIASPPVMMLAIAIAVLGTPYLGYQLHHSLTK